MTSPIVVSIRILLLDNEPIIRAGLKLLLEKQPGLRVFAQAGDDKTALGLAEQEQPDIVLFHESSGDMLRFALLPQLMAVLENPRIILLTPINFSEYHVQAVQHGAMGVVLSRLTPEVLYKAIEKVYEGEVWLDRSLVANVLASANRQKFLESDTVPRKVALLSEREREIIVLVGAGLKNQQIAERLFLSDVTIRHHLTSIFKKLQVSDRLELVIYAYKNRLAELPE
ncbi:MAG: response regulator transcription factor [Bacteroidetes bacterium]|nr:response regulator transcription factor [Bacteroidota bacterium]